MKNFLLVNLDFFFQVFW
uniref:Uncharacterized protein n=1 Tax=Rhizophora mucronata TaxID=61149 RepID=A0A2P2Q5Q6_RHIMU